MRKISLLVLTGLLFAKVGMAQDTVVRVVDTLSGDNLGMRVVTNKFWQNWFVGAGAGGQILFGDHDKQAKLGDRVTSGFEFYVGKRFTPGISTRIAINGLKVKGLTQNGAHSTGVRYPGKPWQGYWLYNEEFHYYNAHADVFFNLNNMIGGYKPDRFYQISPYVGLGWMVTWDKPRAREISSNLGIMNQFRLGERVALTLDVRGSMAHDRFDGEEGNRKADGILTAALGLVYNFKKSVWDKPVMLGEGNYDAVELANLRARITQLVNDNESLRQQLASAKSQTVTDVQVKNNYLVAPILVTFPINKSTVSNEARVNLGFFAKTIMRDRGNVVYTITGYADKGTGTPAINSSLSRARALAIKNVLVTEFGVPESRLNTKYEGGVDNMYYNDPRLSRAVITMSAE